MSVRKEKGLIQVELILFLLGLVIVLLGTVWVWYTFHENEKLKEEKAKTDITIHSQNDTIERDKKADAVTQDSNTQAAKDQQASDQTHAKIKADGQVKVEQINRDARVKEGQTTDLSVKAAIETARINEVSGARIDTLWQAYCAAAPTAPVCQAPKS